MVNGVIDGKDVVHVRRELWEEKERQIRELSDELAACKRRKLRGLDPKVLVNRLSAYPSDVIAYVETVNDGSLEAATLKSHSEGLFKWLKTLDITADTGG